MSLWSITRWQAGQVANLRRRVRPPMPGGAPQSACSSLDLRACTTAAGEGGGGNGSGRRGRTTVHTERIRLHDLRHGYHHYNLKASGKSPTEIMVKGDDRVLRFGR